MCSVSLDKGENPSAGSHVWLYFPQFSQKSDSVVRDRSDSFASKEDNVINLKQIQAFFSTKGIFAGCSSDLSP
jgi:hypothetical protein